eukprot:492695_1
MGCVSLISIPYFVVAICQFILLVSIIKYVYNFFVGVNSKQRRTRLSKTIFIPVCLFIVISVLAEFFIGVTTMLLSFGKNKCITANKLDQVAVLNSSLFVLQIYLMMLLMFLRLKLVFTASIFLIPKYITVIFLIILAFGPSLGLVFAIIARFQQTHFQSTTTINAILLFFIVICIVSLTCLFICKLIQVYKSANPERQLVSQVTKATILCLVTVAGLILLVLILIITARVIKNSYVQQTFRTFMNGVDIYMNFLCIILSFRYFSDNYDKCCHRLDSKCKYCWGKIMLKDEMEIRNIMDAQSQTSNATSNATSNDKVDDVHMDNNLSVVKSISSTPDNNVALSMDISVQKNNENNHNT